MAHPNYVHLSLGVNENMNDRTEPSNEIEDIHTFRKLTLRGQI